jgi:hypothetical protein
LSCVFCVLRREHRLGRADHTFRGVLPGVCDLETSTMRSHRPEFDCCVTGKSAFIHYSITDMIIYAILVYVCQSSEIYILFSCTVKSIHLDIITSLLLHIYFLTTSSPYLPDYTSYWYGAVTGFWRVEFSNRRLGASH